MKSRFELATLVELRRAELGMTQTELARLAGVSRQWVNALEASVSNPSFTNLVAVLAALGLELDVIPATDKQP